LDNFFDSSVGKEKDFKYSSIISTASNWATCAAANSFLVSNDK